jgi:alpha-L-arabinofuranosidase
MTTRTRSQADSVKRTLLTILGLLTAVCCLRSPNYAQTLTATATVYANQVLRTIPGTLYGTSLEWPDNGDQLWNPDLNAPVPSVLSNTLALQPSVIRFPTSEADFYNWQDGVGPVNQRPAQPPFPGQSPVADTFGTDEFLDFAAQVGSQALITANVGTGTAAEAAAWVQYTNGSQPGRVPFWEIGNEIYDKDGYGYQNVSIPPTTYAAAFLQYSQAMRQVDPTIKLAAAGGNSPLLVMYPNWDQTVLTQAASQIDYLAVHDAFAPMNLFQGFLPLPEVYAAMLAAPIVIGQNLQSISNEIDEWGGQWASQIRIAVTEWTPMFTLNASPYYLHPKTLGSALFVASTLQQFIQNPRTDIACALSLTSDAMVGQLGTRQGVFIPNSQYYALQMYRLHFGTQLVATAASSPTYNSTAVGDVPAVNNVPYLDIVSSLSADGTKLYIMAVNKHFDSPIQTTFTINDFTPTGSGTAWYLSGSGIDANTGTDWPPLGYGFIPAQNPQNPQFLNGNPAAIVSSSLPVSIFANTFTFSFGAHSVTSLEIDGM